MKKDREIELVKLAKQGDRNAFDKLFKGYFNRLVSFLSFHFNISKESAEDIAIESMTKAFKNIGKFEISNRFSTWLYKIAKNHAIDILRLKKYNCTHIVENTQNEDEPYFEFIDLENTPYKLTERHLIDEAIQNAANSISNTFKDTFFLFYFQNKSLKEISTILNIPANTVKTRLYNARQEFKEKFMCIYPYNFINPCSCY